MNDGAACAASGPFGVQFVVLTARLVPSALDSLRRLWFVRCTRLWCKLAEGTCREARGEGVPSTCVANVNQNI